MNAPPDVLPRWLDAMRAGDFEAAWRQTDRIELPRRAADRGERRPHELRWDGTPFEGRRVLVRCEHGLGDSIQFLRWLPLLRQRARQVFLDVQPALLPLFTGTPHADAVRSAWTTDPPPAHDVEVECMELPYAFRATPAELPSACYLRLPALPPVSLRGPGPHVGLVWASSAWDRSRGVPPSALRPMAEVPGITWHSLQQEHDPREVLAAAGLEASPLRTDTVLHTAAAMCALDLVVTVDSMPAHLAGTLGVPTWLLLRHDADWRWLADRASSPWYPTMRLFRQGACDGWNGVIRSLAEALARAVP